MTSCPGPWLLLQQQRRSNTVVTTAEKQLLDLCILFIISKL